MRPQLARTGYELGLVIESERLWQGISAGLTAARIEDWRLDSDYYEIALDDHIVAAVIGQGAPIAADAVERMVGSGCRRVVRLGTCGGLQSAQRIGGLVVAAAAIRGEGTSRAYLPAGFPAVADPDLAALIHDAAARVAPAPVQKGVVWTTDHRWVETDADIRRTSELGVLAVDMETSACFAVGTARRIRVASVSVIVDLPIDHLGQDFKGLPGLEQDWSRCTRTMAQVLHALLGVLLQPELA